MDRLTWIVGVLLKIPFSPYLHEEALVNLRRISDIINFYGREVNDQISKKTLTGICWLSWNSYRQALEEIKKKQEASFSTEERKRKLLVQKEI